MTRSKTAAGMILALLAFLFLSGGAALWSSDALPGFQEQEQATARQEKQEKEKQAEKEEDIGDTMKRRMDQGESMFEIIGIPTPEDYMPTPFEVVLLWLIPFSVIVGIILLIVIVSRRRHQRILAMIEKGILPDAKAINRFKSAPFRWDMFLLLTGLILGLGGIGLSLFMMGQKGTDQWYTGTIPVFVGAALLVFHQIFFRKKKE